VIVIDASVAVKWVVREMAHEAALAVVDKPWTRVAPDLLLPEVTNVLRKKRKAEEITDAQVKSGLLGVKAAVERFIPSADIAGDAFVLAQELDHSAYDCFYLACALGRGMLLSADDRFIQKCRSGGYDEFVASLNDVESGRLDARLASRLLDTRSLNSIIRLSEQITMTFRIFEQPTDVVSASRFALSDSRTLVAAFDSPAYRRLCEELETMSADSLAIVVALGWLGRSDHAAEDWPRLHLQACRMARDGFNSHRKYFISQMGQVALGMEKLRNYLAINDDGEGQN
jgi:predicted nucleic acid-binding protein